MDDGKDKETMDNDLPLPDLNAEAGLINPALATDEDNAPVLTGKTADDLEHVFDVPVNVSAVLGRTRLDVGELLGIAPGRVLELDRKVGESIDIMVNNRLVARGEVVLVEDRLGVTMTEIIKHER
jgi:flagellar motor switch protein FliN